MKFLRGLSLTLLVLFSVAAPASSSGEVCWKVPARADGSRDLPDRVCVEGVILHERGNGIFAKLELNGNGGQYPVKFNGATKAATIVLAGGVTGDSKNCRPRTEWYLVGELASAAPEIKSTEVSRVRIDSYFFQRPCAPGKPKITQLLLEKL